MRIFFTKPKKFVPLLRPFLPGPLSLSSPSLDSRGQGQDDKAALHSYWPVVDWWSPSAPHQPLAPTPAAPPAAGHGAPLPGASPPRRPGVVASPERGRPGREAPPPSTFPSAAGSSARRRGRVERSADGDLPVRASAGSPLCCRWVISTS